MDIFMKIWRNNTIFYLKNSKDNRDNFWKIILSPTMLHMDFFLFVQVTSFSSQTLKGIL
jgi:hypothetical protein